MRYNNTMDKLAYHLNKKKKPAKTEGKFFYYYPCKKLFDAFIKEIIFDGKRYLIVLKTCNMPDYPITDE